MSSILRERDRHGRTSLGLLLGLVVALCVGAYLLLRIPTAREELLALVRHRPKIEKSMQRRLLAPRSVLLAGMAGAGVLLLCAGVPRLRRTLRTPVPRGQRLVVLFVAGQALVAVAVVVNLQAYYLRAYGQRPLWRIPEEEVLAHDVPRVWPDAMQLKTMFPEGARIAMKAPLENAASGGGDKFMLHGLAYPVALFDLSPTTADWRDDPKFVEDARRYNVQYILDYRDGERENRLNLEPFQWELSGWRH